MQQGAIMQHGAIQHAYTEKLRTHMNGLLIMNERNNMKKTSLRAKS